MIKETINCISTKTFTFTKMVNEDCNIVTYNITTQKYNNLLFYNLTASDNGTPLYLTFDQEAITGGFSFLYYSDLLYIGDIESNSFWRAKSYNDAIITVSFNRKREEYTLIFQKTDNDKQDIIYSQPALLDFTYFRLRKMQRQGLFK